MVKLYQRTSRHTYRQGKGTYTYARYYLPIPAHFREVVRPFLHKDLFVDINVITHQHLLLIMAQEKPTINLGPPTKTPAPTPPSAPPHPLGLSVSRWASSWASSCLTLGLGG